VQRGSLPLGFRAEVLPVWQKSERPGQRGQPRTYSATASLPRATRQESYHLGVRQTQGWGDSVGELVPLEGAIASSATLRRRRATVEIELARPQSKEALPGVGESTGGKVCGEGEGTVRPPGSPSRRTWRKGQRGSEEASGEMGAAVVTPTTYRESHLLPARLTQGEKESEHGSGEGGYDTRQWYEALGARHARAPSPPQHNATIWQPGHTKAERRAREEKRRRMRQGGRAAWKRERGYPRRRWAETARLRRKPSCRDRGTARGVARQAAQGLGRWAALKRLPHLGRPDSYRA
jgi:hypothetical protein